ncbi:NAD(P)/FAD-dependent oxidoreductase [Sphingobacterium kitahiroshimense]|uniref:NAD(P)/FAD-dependent oxidoreductase n=1 Tax=Sphingobacterium kitahiroshimense TaxID=470446 RepID=UPI00320928EC
MVDSSNGVKWFFGHQWMSRFKSGINGLVTYRPHFEAHLRQRLLAAYSNVNMIEGFRMEGLLNDKTNNCIIGITGQMIDGRKENINCSLTVDTTGRESKLPQWLNAIGYSAPREKAIELQLGYTSRIYNRLAKFDYDWSAHAVYANFPNTGRGGGITYPITDQWMVTLTGYFGDHAPADDTGFLDFAKSLAKPIIYQLIKDEKPIVNSKVYKIPKIRRRYYEELSDFPGGLAVIGDAVCFFNPLFAQGITVSALCVAELEKFLAKQKKTKQLHIKGHSAELQKKIAACLRTPWHMTNIINYSYPQLKGRRPFFIPMTTWMLKRTIETCATHRSASRIFLEVMHMNAPLNNFLRLSFIFPLLCHSIKYVLKPRKSKLQ